MGDELGNVPSKKKKKSDSKCCGDFHVTVNVLPSKPELRQENLFCERAKLAQTSMLACSGGRCVSPGAENDKIILGVALSISLTLDVVTSLL